MKKHFFLFGLIATAVVLKAQNTFPSSGNAGIGTTTPGYMLDMVVPASFGTNGIRIKHNGSNSSHLNLQTSGTGAGNFMIGVTGASQVEGNGRFVIHDGNAHVTRLLIDPNGRLGFNTNTPAYMMDLALNSSTDDGMQITQYGSAAASLYLFKYFGTNWSLNSLNTGDFCLRNNSSSFDAMNVLSNGIVGLGGTSYSAKFQVHNYSSTSQAGAIFSESYQNGSCFGASGNAISSAGTFGAATGVAGYGLGAQTNYGGYFMGIPNCAGGGASYGIYASVNNGVTMPCTNDYAGFFDGNVNALGSVASNYVILSSDKKLKKDIKPLGESLDKIQMLKPSTYLFRTDEFKAMNLPNEQQIGLIAQELEEVFPELVSTIGATEKLDKDGKVIGTVPEHKAVNYIGLIPILINGIQEQQRQINTQAEEIASLKRQVENNGSATTGLNESSLNDRFEMAQNEPNPFNNETIIKYTLPQQVEQAKLIIYDLNGKQLFTLPIEERGSSGITISSEKLAAGIYIYSIMADGKIFDSKRMVVMDK